MHTASSGTRINSDSGLVQEAGRTLVCAALTFPVPCLQAVAELLTTDKLSELACVTLYMMYEKMNGKKSRWHPYIKELDRCVNT